MRLFVLYVLIWIPSLGYEYWTIIDFPVEITATAYFYMYALIAIFLYATLIFHARWQSRAVPTRVRAQLCEMIVNRYMVRLALIWSFIYSIEILLSGGVPIIWTDGRDYKDFGIPVLHGLSNSIRGLNFGLLVTFILLKIRIRTFTQLVIYFSIFSALILEQSRGAFLVSISFAAGSMLLYLNFKIKTIFKIFLAFIFLILTFPVIQLSRYSDTPILTTIEFYQKLSNVEDIRKPFIPLENYIITPVINAGLNIEAAHTFSFEPYHTIKPLIPSFIRDKIFEDKDYGLIFNKAFNTTSFITPFVRDFGLVGSFLILTIYFLFCSYTFARARHGSLIHIFRLGPVCMTLIMSFFTSYLTSLLFIFAIILSTYIARVIILNSRRQFQRIEGVHQR